ncbi:MAG: hypothetical protein ACD_10C00762G0001, partial [uncultured bacterium]
MICGKGAEQLASRGKYGLGPTGRNRAQSGKFVKTLPFGVGEKIFDNDAAFPIRRGAGNAHPFGNEHAVERGPAG